MHAGHSAMVLADRLPRAGSTVTAATRQIGILTDKSKRIRKLIAKHPEMTDAQIARKIGMPDSYGAWRAREERKLMKAQATGN